MVKCRNIRQIAYCHQQQTLSICMTLSGQDEHVQFNVSVVTFWLGIL